MRKTLFKDVALLKDAIAVGAQQALGRFILWLGCHGVILPWYSWAESSVSSQTLDRYRRRAMVAKLRVQRFKITRGPFFLRGVLEQLFVFFRFMQFPVLLTTKFLGAFVICLLPLAIFFLIRVYLPVPQRMSRQQSSMNISLVDKADVVRPRILRLDSVQSQVESDTIELYQDGLFEFRPLDNRSGEGLLIQGRGGAHEEIFRGWRLNPGRDLLVALPSEVDTKNLRLKYKAIPTGFDSGLCKIDVTTDVGEFVFASTFDSSPAVRNRFLKTPLTRRLQEKLMPDLAQHQSVLSSSPISLNLPHGKHNFRFSLKRIDDGEKSACDVFLYGFEKPRAPENTARVVKRNLLLLLFKSLNADLAVDDKVMPWLSSVLRSSRGVVFNQHHALDVRDNQSFNTLMGISESDAVGGRMADQNLFERARQNGYRTIVLGDLDTSELPTKMIPDIMVRITNRTYQPRLVLTHLMRILEDESSSPAFVVVRLAGMQSPWWPVFADIDLNKMLFGGSQRGFMDTLLFAHSKSLDKELAWHFGELKRTGLFSKFDFVVTGEKGLDLGLQLPSQQSEKVTFTSDLLLNEDSLRVPLVYIPSPSLSHKDDSLQVVQNVSTHFDLSRTIWETIGMTDAKFPLDARRLWRTSSPSQSRENLLTSSVLDAGEQIKLLPIHSRIQEGVLFIDPNSSVGFLKYVSQAVPAQMITRSVQGWPGRQLVFFPAGEQFRQVSRKGAREEVLGRVNSRFIRESRRMIRMGRRFPLRFRFEFHSKMPIDLQIEESIVKESGLVGELPSGLKKESRRKDDKTILHRLHGAVEEGQILEIFGSLSQLRFLDIVGPAAFVACPEAFVFTAQALNAAVAQKSACLLENPDHQRIKKLKAQGQKLVSIWLVEDEKQICKEHSESEGSDNYSDCSETQASQARRD